MEKNDWIWVAIRIFGIYLIVLAITSVPPLALNAYILHSGAFEVDTLVAQDTSSNAENVNKMQDLAFHATRASLTESIVRVVLFSLIGFYFLHSGKLIFKLTSRK